MDDYDYERYEDEIYKENVTDSESESSQNADNILAQIYYTVEKPKLTQQDPSKNNNSDNSVVNVNTTNLNLNDQILSDNKTSHQLQNPLPQRPQLLTQQQLVQQDPHGNNNNVHVNNSSSSIINSSSNSGITNKPNSIIVNSSNNNNNNNNKSKRRARPKKKKDNNDNFNNDNSNTHVNNNDNLALSSKLSTAATLNNNPPLIIIDDDSDDDEDSEDPNSDSISNFYKFNSPSFNNNNKNNNKKNNNNNNKEISGSGVESFSNNIFNTFNVHDRRIGANSSSGGDGGGGSSFYSLNVTTAPHNINNDIKNHVNNNTNNNTNSNGNIVNISTTSPFAKKSSINIGSTISNPIGGINTFNTANAGGSNNPRLDDMATHIITPIRLKYPSTFHSNKKMRAELDDDNYNRDNANAIPFISSIPRESGCSWCNETTHTEEVCESQLRIHEVPWRQYKLEDPPANHRPGKVFCFKCASSKHIGQQCDVSVPSYYHSHY